MFTPALPLVVLLALGAPSASAATKDAAHPLAAELGGTWPAHVSGKKVTVEAKTPNDALKQIATAAGWGLALNTGAAGDANVEFSFKKVGVEEAFAAVLSAAHLQSTRIGDSIAVTSKRGTHAEAADSDDEAEDAARDAAEQARENAEDAKQDAEDAKRDAEEAVKDAQDSLADGGLGALLDGGIGAVAGLPRLRKNDHHRHHSNGNDRVQIGQDIDIPAGQQVGDVVAVGGSIHLNAGVSTGDVVAIGGSIDTEPGVLITGQAISVGGSVHLAPGVQVKGDSVTLGGVLQMDPGATVKGQQVNLGAGRLFAFGVPAVFAGGLTILFLVSKLAQFVLFFCLGALLLLAAPGQLTNIEALMLRNPVRAGLAGFLMTLAIPVLTVLLVVTIVGIPLVAVEFFGIGLASLMGFTAISVLIGKRIQIPIRGGGLLGLAVGTAIVVALTALPWIGTLFLITSWFVALGAALVTRFGSVPQA